jgi:hypothetical protein
MDSFFTYLQGISIIGVPGKGQLVLGFWFLVSGFWFLVSGFWFLVSGFWFLVSGFWFLKIESPWRNELSTGISALSTLFEMDIAF